MDGSIVIRAFAAADQAAVKALVLDGLREHWGALDPTLNPDLNAIAETFSLGFFVAARQQRIIATGGLTRVDDSTLRIERMSVAKDQRRLGVGSRILARLLEHARFLGANRIILETTSTWLEARRFYEQAGFTYTLEANGDTYYELWL